VNLDNSPDASGKPKPDIFKPRKGVDDQVAINEKNQVTSETNLKPATRGSVAFHELAEAYEKVDGGKPYASAHNDAAKREQKLRGQRPNLREHNPGSGPGDKVIIKR